MEPIVITGPDTLDLDWTKEPVFRFGTEVDGLMTLEELGHELRAAREQERHIMRFIKAAVLAARHNGEGDTQPQAIINHTGLARQTIYNMLGEKA